MSGEVLDGIVVMATLLFVVSSMLAMGSSLTVKQIAAPLSSARLVVIALAVNFVVVPLIAYGIDFVLDLSESLFTGLLLMATAAGAPFLPKLVQAAKGDAAFSVGMMVLLMVATVIVVPLALPLLIEGVEVNAWDIASSLIVLMLIPLIVGLFIRWRYESGAVKLESMMSSLSTVALGILIVAGIIANWSSITGLLGTRGILAALLFIGFAFLAGYLLSGGTSETRTVMGLGTGQRNVSAAFVVAVQNFADDPDVLAFLIAASMVGLVILMTVAGELGRRRSEAGMS